MDIGNGIILATVSKTFIEKFLGPSCEYLGEKMRDKLKKFGEKNLGSLFKKVHDKVGGQKLDEGGVSIRLLRDVLFEGQLCEDEVIHEYLAGILISSRDLKSSNDAGVGYLATIRSLSHYQVKLHYLIYYHINKIYGGNPHILWNSDNCQKMGLYIPSSTIQRALGLEHMDTENYYKTTLPLIFELARHDLVEKKYFTFALTPKEINRYHSGDTREGGLIAMPSSYGAALFVFSMGYGVTPTGFVPQGALRCELLPPSTNVQKLKKL